MHREQQARENWTGEAQDYSAHIQKELNSFLKRAWTGLIAEHAGTGGPLDVLDAGAGPGFFAIIMALAGHRVTAVDCTEAMVDAARTNAEQAGVSVLFSVSDSHALNFPDGSFDLVISRNVVWTLTDAARAFAEWRRLLRPGGRTLIFDANWNRYLFDDEARARRDEDIRACVQAFGAPPAPHTEAMLEYRRSLPMSRRVRPQWDLAALVDAGYKTVYCDTNINDRIYDEKKKIVNRSTPMFLLVAEK
jgi:ubiquinone/menaquinone biosynthesis C-methylase UbiE